MGKTLANPDLESRSSSPEIARNLERIPWLMDRAIRIPGTKITVGLDALVGLLPIGGDLLTGIVQAGVVLVALYHYKVPKVVAARMVGNVLLDIAVGAIPLLGDLFDVAFKANTRNLRLLEPYRPQHEPPGVTSAAGWAGALTSRTSERRSIRRGTPWRYLLPIAAVLLAVLTLIVIGLVTVIRWIF